LINVFDHSLIRVSRMSHYKMFDKYRDEILNGSVLRVLFKLGLPLMIVNILMLAYNLADAYWLGRYNEYALSVPRQAWPVIMLFAAFINSFSAANMAILSQYIGARVYDKAGSVVSNLFTFNILYGLIGCLILNLFAEPIFSIVVRTPPEIFGYTIIYVRIMSIDLILSSILFTLSTLMQSIGDTMTPARIQSYGAIINAILDPFFINGAYVIPPMGVAGAALVSITSRLSTLLMLIMVFRRRYGFIKISIKPRLDPTWLRLTLYAGTPIYAMMVSNSLAFTLNNSIVNSFGVIAATAFAVGFIILDIADNILWGLTQAVTIMVGQNLGAEKFSRARMIGLKASHTLFLLIAAGAVFVYVFHENFVTFFVESREIIDEANLMISLTSLTLPFFGLFFTGLSVGRGSGRTLVPSLIGIIRLWGIRLGMGYYLSIILSLGTFGYWIALSLSNLAGGLLAYIWVRYGKWAKPIIKKNNMNMSSKNGDEKISQ